MRQFGDTLVWLALIAAVAAVLYLTPRVASYVSSRDREPLRGGSGSVVYRVIPDWEEPLNGE